LLGLNLDGLSAHPLVLRGDKYFREQSGIIAQSYDEFDEEQIELLHETFVKTIGGKYVY